MARTLFILNDPSYGAERSYNALRLTGALSKREHEEIRIFLMGDAVVGVCGTRVDARGIAEAELTDGARRGMLEEPTDWTQWAERTLVF